MSPPPHTHPQGSPSRQYSIFFQPARLKLEPSTQTFVVGNIYLDNSALIRLLAKYGSKVVKCESRFEFLPAKIIANEYVQYFSLGVEN